MLEMCSTEEEQQLMFVRGVPHCHINRKSGGFLL